MLLDSSYLANHTVLELSEAREQDSSVLHQLFIQVHERFPFTPGPDPIMASLMADLADCFAATTSIEHAKAMYEIARQYYGDTTAVLNEKINDIIQLRTEYNSVRPERRNAQIEGEHLKIKGIRYKDLIDNNDNPPFEVDWIQYETNPDTLLAWVGLERIDRTQIKENQEVPATNNENQNTASEENKNEDGSNWWLIGVILACITPLLAVVFVRRKK